MIRKLIKENFPISAKIYKSENSPSSKRKIRKFNLNKVEVIEVN